MSVATTTIDIQLLEAPPCLPPRQGDPGGGAECTFIGRTRPEEDAELGSLESLEYEAYSPMARSMLEAMALCASEQWACLSIQLHHGICNVPVGEISVVARVVSEHRADAFAACQWLMDELKRSVPIWKRERWTRGHSWSDGTLPSTPAEAVS